MLIFDLYPLTIHGRRARTLKEAAYLIRQYAIDYDDLWGWKLTHILRSAETASDIERAEDALRSWIQTKQVQQRQSDRIIPANSASGKPQHSDSPIPHEFRVPAR